MQVFFFAIPFALIILFYGYMIRGDKKLIRAALEKKKAKNIIISYYLMGRRPRTNNSYYITYEDARGKPHHTRCRVNQLNVTLEWEDED